MSGIYVSVPKQIHVDTNVGHRRKKATYIISKCMPGSKYVFFEGVQLNYNNVFLYFIFVVDEGRDIRLPLKAGYLRHSSKTPYGRWWPNIDYWHFQWDPDQYC